MASPKTSLSLPRVELRDYVVEDTARVLTPALLIYPGFVEHNIDVTLKLLDGDAGRWRPHVKTSKLEFVMRRYLARGVSNFKCSTSLELLTLCRIGAPDALIAYPLVGANARRVHEISDAFPNTRISALVENIDQVASWEGSRVGIFVDINPGMDRTGVQQNDSSAIIDLIQHIKRVGCEFRGLHYYDGQLGSFDLTERERLAHQGYDRLLELVRSIESIGISVGEIITAGTPSFPCTLTYPGFRNASFIHRASPGTVIYGDCSSLAQLPSDWGYRPAAVVLSTVVSHPSPGRITCDAGHKTVSADAGAPTCAVIGEPDLVPSKPSEEHLPIDGREAILPSTGAQLYLVPRHVCPTINNFDHALLIEGGRITGAETVTARGREFPLLDN